MFSFNFTNVELNSYFLKWIFITLFGLFIVYFLPNQYQMTKKYDGALTSTDSVNLNLLKNNLFIWQPNLIWAMYHLTQTHF